jgi:hypothetical protein
MIKNIVVVSDTHCGCRFGLCPPKVILDGGVVYKSSKLQKQVWDMWNYFWKVWVPETTKGEDYVLVHNGDIIDGVHHNSVHQISHNLTDQRKIAKECFKIPLQDPHCSQYYQIRGTAVHSGQSGMDEEEIAQDLQAKKDEFGMYSRDELWLKFGNDNNLLCHFTHHVGVTNSTAYESTAVYKELVEAYNEAGRWKTQPPDIVVRSHRHRQFKVEISSSHTNAIALITPGWQLKTPFTFRGTLGRSSTPQIGGVIIREGDEVPIYVRSQVWNIRRSKVEVI